jgi:hypothetical protein
LLRHLDIVHVILLLAAVYFLWRMVRILRQIQAVASFWVERWNELPPLNALGGLTAIDTRKVIEEAGGDRRVPNASLNGPMPAPVTRELSEGFPGAL